MSAASEGQDDEDDADGGGNGGRGRGDGWDEKERCGSEVGDGNHVTEACDDVW